MAPDSSGEDTSKRPSNSLERERTFLARERTILAHIRAGISLFIFGTVIIGFYNASTTAVEVGGVVIVFGLFFFIFGWVSYIRSNRRINAIVEEIEEPIENN